MIIKQLWSKCRLCIVFHKQVNIKISFFSLLKQILRNILLFLIIQSKLNNTKIKDLTASYKCSGWGLSFAYSLEILAILILKILYNDDILTIVLFVYYCINTWREQLHPPPRHLFQAIAPPPLKLDCTANLRIYYHFKHKKCPTRVNKKSVCRLWQ